MDILENLRNNVFRVYDFLEQIDHENDHFIATCALEHEYIVAVKKSKLICREKRKLINALIKALGSASGVNDIEKILPNVKTICDMEKYIDKMLPTLDVYSEFDV
jgi:hypothetical protein